MVFSYESDSTVIGIPRTYRVSGNESLIEIGRTFGLGYNEITEANPGIDPFVPGNGQSVLVPTAWILPGAGLYRGIVINLSEMRLYYYFGREGRSLVATFPIGIGREGFDTPEGEFTIVEKSVNPPWIVPKSIRREYPSLPSVVQPGPDNPIGTHVLRLSRKGILIHGTNRPFGIGRYVSHGCIRLYPEDIPVLFSLVDVGTRVRIIRKPIKLGIDNGKLYLEVHREKHGKTRDYYFETIRLLQGKGMRNKTSSIKLNRAVAAMSGVPSIISP